MPDLRRGKSLVTDTNASILDRAAEAAVRATPEPLAKAVRGLSDRSVAWLFIAPTIILLLAINIFPLIWAIRLSFTNYRANRPNAEIVNVGLRQLPAHPRRQRHLDRHADDGAFRVLDDPAADADRLHARLSDRPQVPRPRLLDDHHPGADDAVAGRGRQFLALPLRAADRAVRLCRLVLLRHSADRDPDAEQRVAGALGDHHRRHLDVDALRDADLPRRAALDPRLHLRGGRGRPRLATGGSSGRSRCRWRCPSSCWRCCSAASRTSRCSTW